MRRSAEAGVLTKLVCFNKLYVVMVAGCGVPKPDKRHVVKITHICSRLTVGCGVPKAEYVRYIEITETLMRCKGALFVVYYPLTTRACTSTLTHTSLCVYAHAHAVAAHTITVHTLPRYDARNFSKFVCCVPRHPGCEKPCVILIDVDQSVGYCRKLVGADISGPAATPDQCPSSRRS